jgi:hypothetical protein
MNEKLQKEVEDAKVEGWQLDSEHSDKAILVKRGWGTLGGHVLVGLLTIWWTLGIGNVLYAAYKYFVDTDKKVVRQEDVS